MHYSTRLFALVVHIATVLAACTCGSQCNSTATSTKQTSTSDLIVTGWYATYDQTALPLDQVSWSKYNYMSFFVSITTNSTSSIGWGDPVNDPASLKDFVSHAHQNKVKALLTVGGWTGSQFFSNMVATADNRTEWAKTLLDVVNQYKLDGLDFDWEYPNKDTGMGNHLSSDDTANFLAFLTTLRAQGPNLTLAVATPTVPWNDANGQPSTNLSAFALALDYVALMNYDTFGAGFSNTTGPNAPLGPPAKCADAVAAGVVATSSASEAVKAWVAAGFPAGQLVLGVPAYGHAFPVAKSAALNAATGSIATPYAPFERNVTDPDKVGTLTFGQLVSKGYLDDNGAAAHGVAFSYDACTEAPFLYNEAAEVLVAYDDATSFQFKGDFVKERGLGGFAMFEVNGDHNDILLDAIRKGAGLSS